MITACIGFVIHVMGEPRHFFPASRAGWRYIATAATVVIANISLGDALSPAG